MTRSAGIVVLGAGLIGLATARALAQQGRAVTVVERTIPGAGASSAAAGMLAPLGDAPGILAPITRTARDQWPTWRDEIQDESGLAIEMGRDGALLVALDESDEAALGAIRTQAEFLGEVVEDWSDAEARAFAPDLRQGLRRILHVPGERRVDNVAALAALTRAATLLGVRVLADFEVIRVELGAGGVRVVNRTGRSVDSSHLVLAAGIDSAALLGLPSLPVYAVRGQMMRLEDVRWRWDGIVRRPALYAVRRGTSGLLVGATVEPEVGDDPRTTVAGLGALLDWTRATFPTLADHAVAETWAGLRPATPDHLPLLGPLPNLPRVIAATGHYRNGILLAPWTAAVIAETLQSGRLPERARAFDVARLTAAS